MVVTSEGGAGLGVRGMVASPSETWWSGELAADLGATQLGPYASTRAGLRFFAQPQTEPGLGALLAVGAAVDSNGARPVGHAGLGLNLLTPGRVRWRVDVGLDMTVRGVDALHAGVSAMLGPRGERPLPEPEPVQPEPDPTSAPEPESELVAEPEPAPPLAVEPDYALVWIPHPVCAWVPAAESGPLLAEYNGDQPIQVSASGFLPAAVEPGAGPVELEPAPEQGGIIVSSWPGDEVIVGEQTLLAGGSGVAVVSAPAGPVQLVVRGSGRQADIDGYVGDGLVLWVTVPDPEPTLVLFDSGSNSLNAGARAALTAIAQNMGSAVVELIGGSSPEGNPAANDRLSRQRAEAVKAFLIERGVREDQLVVGTPEVADGPPGPTQRRVTITPVRSGS